MLPSIRHLLDSDPAAERANSNNNIRSTSNVQPGPPSPPTDMPTIADHYRKGDGHRHNNMIAVEGPYPQCNTPQYRQTQHHPHPPYEPLHPPHPHSHDDEYSRDLTPIPIPSSSASVSKPVAHHEALSFRQYGSHRSGSPREDDRYYAQVTHLGHGPSSSEANPGRNTKHSSSPRASSKSSFYSDNAPGRAPGSLTTPLWQTQSSMQDQGPPGPSPSAPSSYRSQQRTSSFDPSVSSSSSSASPSPSISTATAASTPLVTDSIAAVTNGTAAASISDVRSRYGGPISRSSIREDYRNQDIERLSMSADYSDCAERSNNETAPLLQGGMVESAPQHPSRYSSSFRRGSHLESASDYQPHARHSPPQYPEELLSRTSISERHSSNLNFGHFPPGQGEHRPLHTGLHRHSQIHYGGEHGPQRHSPPSDGIQGQPDSHMHFTPSSTPQPHYAHSSGPNSTHDYSSSPSSPSQKLVDASQKAAEAQRKLVSDRSPEACHDDRRRPVDFEPPLHPQGQRFASASSPGPPGTRSIPSPPLSSSRQQSSTTLHSPHHPSHPTLQQQQHPPPLYDPVRESDHRTFRSSTTYLASTYPAHQVRQPSYEPSQPLPHQRLSTANSSSSVSSLEAPLSRQPGFQHHGLAARSERMTSPASSHPYYTPAHSSRPFHTLSNNADSRDGRFKDENRQSSRVSMSHLPPPDQPFSYPPSPQFRVIRETRHISERAHVRHSSQGHPPTYTTGHGFDPAEGRNGSWSDGGSGQDHRITETMRNSCDTLSGPLSSSVSPALQRRGSQRSIRPSVSESDLQTMESTDARVRHLVISREDGLNEGEIDELEEGEEDEEEGSEDELDEESEYGGHRRIQSSQSFAHDYDSGMKRHWYDSNHGPDYHGLSPTYPSQRQYHHQAHSYDESSLRHPSRGLAATATQRPSGHPIHGQQHPQSYPPPRSHPQMPSQHSHTGQYHSQQQLQLQLQQHSRMAHYQHSAPPSDPSEHHSHSQLHPSSSPKTPSRRGPYLSRQRAIMAGLEVTTPSSRYQCQYCQKRFSRPSSLRIHTYSHTGERPFKCSEEGCGRQFSVQSNMRRHLRVHRLGRLRSEFPPPQE